MPTTYPANYTTSSSTHKDLNGTMKMSNATTISSYTSTNQNPSKTVTPTMLTGGTGLNFKVEFTTGTVYTITSTANSNNNGFDGNSNEQNDGPGGDVDDWVATAV